MVVAVRARNGVPSLHGTRWPGVEVLQSVPLLEVQFQRAVELGPVAMLVAGLKAGGCS
jgi:hypothetical protein